MDCAIAKAPEKSLLSNSILYIGPPEGVAPAQLDMSVHKFGRTTGYRVGCVTSIDTDVTVQYDAGNIVFAEQMVIRGEHGSFSDSGDSGSVILERATQKVVGLLFAGSRTHTIGNHIQNVLQALQVTLA